MMPCDYRSLSGQLARMDLDSVIDVVGGWSARRPGWQAFIVFLPDNGRFVELQSTPPDIQGNSADESEEVTREYVLENFLSADELSSFMESPRNWQFLERRE
jgi:hypothetical protein